MQADLALVLSIIVGVASFLFGLVLGTLQSQTRYYEKGIVESPIILRIRAFESGKCPLCGYLPDPREPESNEAKLKKRLGRR